VGPGFVPHEAKPQPPTIHSVNPNTAGRHTDGSDEALYPLGALCSNCGQPVTKEAPDGGWVHRELTKPPARVG
jgi:hypothetical protein